MPGARPTAALPTDGGPLYQRIADRLQAELAGQGAGGGTRLPSERHLTEHYGVSRVTVRAALRELDRRGVLTSLPARGWVVAEGAFGTPGTAAGQRVRGFADLAADRGLRATSRVLVSGTRPATTAEADVLRTAPGTTLFEMRRVRRLNDLAVAVEHNLLPLAVAPALPTVDFSTASLYAVLRSADPPKLPRVAEYSVEARNPTDVERELLDIDGPVPILQATQVTFDEDGRAIEYTVQAYRGDRYTFRASITD
ncbi:GntR family transcriptional regulator [Kineococcus rhizosphaerae]|uniref:GntR family transcriptional regulator n=1 Tax=Kineococcus rhizosphaerae TaxID=559628 RepID=A0A2T0QTJ0_9ACTN|nr:GntR family transcriptional regulator [Kineococcus rhizosphaerae]PRY08301.1 GntR family transcriptional regulator [Kineococcus rhizosphaerae]